MEKFFDAAAFMKKHKPLPKLYMVLDCETATLPFANEMTNNDPEKKKKIAIAKPIIYDISWRVIDRYNNVYSEHSFLVTETFFAPQVFNTAYYKDKRPIYLDYLKKNEIRSACWDEITRILLDDMKVVDFVGAFNSMFDFKKALPFTELYIKKAYSNEYDEWLNTQRAFCKIILNGAHKDRNPDFDKDNFLFRGVKVALIDIWGISCQHIINTKTYKVKCIKESMLSPSGCFFKTSAESTYRYIQNQYDFNEAHTALEDSRIESVILCKALKKAKIDVGIDYFPFKRLGDVVDFVVNNRAKLTNDDIKNILVIMDMKLTEYELAAKIVNNRYYALIVNKMMILQELLE